VQLSGFQTASPLRRRSAAAPPTGSMRRLRCCVPAISTPNSLPTCPWPRRIPPQARPLRYTKPKMCAGNSVLNATRQPLKLPRHLGKNAGMRGLGKLHAIDCFCLWFGAAALCIGCSSSDHRVGNDIGTSSLLLLSGRCGASAWGQCLRLVPELQRIYYETGTQPGGLGGYKIAAIRESLPGGKISWFEKAITDQQTFNALVAFAIIVAFITWWNQ